MNDINLLPPEYRAKAVSFVQWVCLAVIGILFFGVTSFYGYICYQMHAIDKEIEKMRGDDHLFQEIRQRRQSIEKDISIIQAKNAFLRDKSGANLSGYAILVHLGTLMTEGVGIQEVLVNDGRLTLKGYMLDYAHLQKFITGFKTDALFGEAELGNMNMAMERDAALEFEMIVKIKERKDDYDLSGK